MESNNYCEIIKFVFRMRRKFLLAFICVNSLICFGFDSDLISERPGQAYTPYCLKNGEVQFQLGANIQESIFNNNVIRFGLGKFFEINTVIDYTFENNLFVPPNVGFKLLLKESERGIYSLRYGTSLHQFTDNDLTNTLFLISNYTIFNKVVLTLNGGVKYLAREEKLSKSYVLSLSFNPTTKIGVVFENYGEFNDSFKSYFDLGIGYLVSPVLQFDIYLGTGLENKPEDLFINLGVTYRFNL